MAGVRTRLPCCPATKTNPPVILFLHGNGQTGTDGVRQTEIGLPAVLRERSGFPRAGGDAPDAAGRVVGDPGDRAHGARRPRRGDRRVRRRSRADVPHRAVARRLRDLGARLSAPGAVRGARPRLRRHHHAADEDSRARLAPVGHAPGTIPGRRRRGSSRAFRPGCSTARTTGGCRPTSPGAWSRRSKPRGAPTPLHRIPRSGARLVGPRLPRGGPLRMALPPAPERLPPLRGPTSSAPGHGPKPRAHPPGRRSRLGTDSTWRRWERPFDPRGLFEGVPGGGASSKWRSDRGRGRSWSPSRSSVRTPCSWGSSAPAATGSTPRTGCGAGSGRTPGSSGGTPGKCWRRCRKDRSAACTCISRTPGRSGGTRTAAC